jgi:hypothetical protein
MYVQGLSLLTLTSTRLASNFSMVINNIMSCQNTYYIMDGPNHFLVNSLGVTYYWKPQNIISKTELFFLILLLIP